MYKYLKSKNNTHKILFINKINFAYVQKVILEENFYLLLLIL